MLTPDVVGQVAVEKKTLVFVLALATTQPNIEVGVCGGIQYERKLYFNKASVFLSRDGLSNQHHG